MNTLNFMIRCVFYLIISLTAITSCGQTKKENANSLNITTSDIKGNWYLNKWTSYHSLVFGENTVFVDNSVDTVFTLDYEIKNGTLITNTANQQFNNKIIFLSKDSLILEGIGDVKERRSYSRINTHFK